MKGKVLNQFLGFLKTDIARLSFEAFPEYINKQLISLMLLDRQDLIWFDIQIERRVATLRVNLFVGENAGNRVFKVGVQINVLGTFLLKKNSICLHDF